jgi:aspartate/glutamate racemase
MREETATVGVIHATPMSIAPLEQAFAAVLPEVRLRQVLDDSLLAELQAAGSLTPELEARMERLLEYLLSGEVDAVQFACSGYVPVVDRAAARLTIPVRKPDEAMYRQLAEQDGRPIGIVATVEPALALAREQLSELLVARGERPAILTRAVPDALSMAQAGDLDGLTDAIAAAVGRLVQHGASVVAFAQYSLAPVADAVATRTGTRIVTGPHAAAEDLRAALGLGRGPTVANGVEGEDGSP